MVLENGCRKGCLILRDRELTRLILRAERTEESLNSLIIQALLVSNPEVAKAFAIRCGSPSRRLRYR
jgi:hypothetical protein